MKLFEFANDDPLRVKLVSVVSQLKSNIEDSKNAEPMSTEALLDLLKQNDIDIDPSDIYDLIKKDPLVNIIQDIEDDTVIFKGQQGPVGEPDETENEKTLKQMASKQAAKIA